MVILRIGGQPGVHLQPDDGLPFVEEDNIEGSAHVFQVILLGEFTQGQEPGLRLGKGYNRVRD